LEEGVWEEGQLDWDAVSALNAFFVCGVKGWRELSMVFLFLVTEVVMESKDGFLYVQMQM
jgi:hypothetical protein